MSPRSSHALVVLLALAFLGSTAHAQRGSDITVGRTTLASPGSGEPLAESWIAVNPIDPRNMVVCASARGGQATQVYTTHDGGHSWSRAHFAAGGVSVEKGGDAVVYFDEVGTAYTISIDGEGAGVARSTDGGRTWAPGVRTLAMRALDRQYM